MRLKSASITFIEILAAGLLLLLAGSTSGADVPSVPGIPLTQAQNLIVTQAITLLQNRGLVKQADLAATLLKKGLWRAAGSDDVFIAEAQAQGDTPFAYTLSPGYQPLGIVLDRRFFDEATPTGRAAVMIHEMGHYLAYVHTGKSTEFDGYKAEYDSHQQLGLGEHDGLIYFAMLDGAAQYVVPRCPKYRNNPDIQQFLSSGP